MQLGGGASDFAGVGPVVAKPGDVMTVPFPPHEVLIVRGDEAAVRASAMSAAIAARRVHERAGQPPPEGEQDAVTR
jgi:hypothetical protein